MKISFSIKNKFKRINLHSHNEKKLLMNTNSMHVTRITSAPCSWVTKFATCIHQLSRAVFANYF